MRCHAKTRDLMTVARKWRRNVHFSALTVACTSLGFWSSTRNVARAATFEIADPVEFGKIVATNSVLTTNATINAWLEGPVWVPAAAGGGYLLFCDQNNNRLKKLIPPATVTDFLVPPANTLFNGSMLDAQERLIAAEA